MADQRTPAPADAQDKTELAEELLKDVAGGAIYMNSAEPIFMNKANTQVQATTTSQGTDSLKITLADPPGGVR